MSRKRALKGLAVAVILLIVLVVVFIRRMNSPAVGTVKNTPASTQSAKQNQDLTRVYNGQAISFVYPANYETVTSPQNPNYIDVVNFYSTDHTSTHLAVTVVRETLANEPGLNHRKAHPETYRLIASAPNEVVFTSSASGNEMTKYTARNGLVAAISLSVPGQKNLNKEFALVTNSLAWKQ